MKDIDILKQLYTGNHLDERELERAYTLVELLKKEVKRRLKG